MGHPDSSDAPPDVTVVIPCHNAADTLPECLAAIAAQTARPLEVLVVDDASDDGSAAIAAAADCRLIRMPRNGGPSAARNTGIRAARGSVLFFVDADVALRPDAVEHATALLAADPGLDIVHGTYEPEPLSGTGVVERYLVGRESWWRHRCAGPGATVVFAVAAVRATVFERYGPLDEHLRDCEDVEYSTRLAGRARLLITTTVAGRHDAGGTLSGALTTQWRRSVPLPRLAAASQGVRLERVNRLRSLGAAAAGATALAAAPFAWPAAIAAAVLFTLAVASDGDLMRYLARTHGNRHIPAFALLHLSFLLVLAAGIAAGTAALALRRPGPAPTPSERNTDYATH